MAAVYEQYMETDGDILEQEQLLKLMTEIHKSEKSDDPIHASFRTVQKAPMVAVLIDQLQDINPELTFDICYMICMFCSDTIDIMFDRTTRDIRRGVYAGKGFTQYPAWKMMVDRVCVYNNSSFQSKIVSLSYMPKEYLTFLSKKREAVASILNVPVKKRKEFIQAPTLIDYLKSCNLHGIVVKQQNKLTALCNDIFPNLRTSLYSKWHKVFVYLCYKDILTVWLDPFKSIQILTELSDPSCSGNSYDLSIIMRLTKIIVDGTTNELVQACKEYVGYDVALIHGEVPKIMIPPLLNKKSPMYCQQLLDIADQFDDDLRVINTMDENRKKDEINNDDEMIKPAVKTTVGLSSDYAEIEAAKRRKLAFEKEKQKQEEQRKQKMKQLEKERQMQEKQMQDLLGGKKQKGKPNKKK